LPRARTTLLQKSTDLTGQIHALAETMNVLTGQVHAAICEGVSTKGVSAT